MNKYHQILSRVLAEGKHQSNRKGHLYLIARQIVLPLRLIILFLGNVHIYSNNIGHTRVLLSGDNGVKFELNV